jgi:hypothetical protein
MSLLSAPADQEPVGTPPRLRRSLRRTTSHDVTRPDGLSGPMTAACRARDLYTGPTGAAAPVREVRIEARASFDDGKLSHLESDTPGLDLGALVGTAAFSGLRLAAREMVADDHPARSLAYQLLDDLPVAFLLSGRVLRFEGIALGAPSRRLPADICAGWIDGGSLLAGYGDLGPPLHIGPPAPPLLRDDDPLAWHEHGPLPPRSTGRRRRLDASFDNEVARIESWFRDTHVDAEGIETVVHEYTVRAVIDRGTGRFMRSDAVAGPLPYVECPGAAASAGRLVDLRVDGLRNHVSANFTGPSTCTHLNDALRGLEELSDLLVTLEVLDDKPSGAAGRRHQRHDEARPADPEERS